VVVDRPAVAARKGKHEEGQNGSREPVGRLSVPHADRVSRRRRYESRLEKALGDHFAVMRAMFIAYSVFILTGFAFYFYVGLANR
jgi:hypothetical protein